VTDATRDTHGTNGAAVPTPAPELALPEPSAKEKRRIREEARREFKAKELARIEAASTKTKGAPAEKTATEAPAKPLEPEFTDAQLRENAALFLRGVLFPVLSVLARPFGYRLDLASFSEAQAREDGAAWVPVLRLYGWLRTVVSWTAIPARLTARVRDLARKREAAKEATP
jgi:hypothetical protein